MTSRPESDERMLLLLERKRVLDSVWLLTLGFQMLALMLPPHGGGDLGAAGLRVLACGVLYVLAADLGYRLRTPSALRRASYATQCGAMLCLSALWALSGGMDNPLGLVFFAPPLLASGLVGSHRLPWASAALALAAVWTIAWQAPSSADPLPTAGALGAFSAAALGLAAISRDLGDGLMRLYQRIRSQTHPSEEARGMFEAVMREAPQPSLVVYADTLQVAHASESFCRRVLRRPEEVAGRSLFNLLQFEDRAQLESALRREQGELPFQALWIGPERVVVRVFFYRVASGGTRYLHLALQEVTELEHLRTAFHALEDAVLLVGAESELLYANAAAERQLGELYLGKPMADLLRSRRLVPRGGASLAGGRARVSVDGEVWRLEVRRPERGGAAQGCTLFWLSPFGEDETRADREERDPLTGALNRRAFERSLRRAVRGARPDAPVGLALFALSLAKRTGDRAAWQADRMRVAFVQALGEEHRLGDSLCRTDEDEFALILPGLARESAELALQRILWALERRPLAEGGSPPIHVGVAVSAPGESVAALVARADAALEASRRAGGGVCAAPDPEPARSP